MTTTATSPLPPGPSTAPALQLFRFLRGPTDFLDDLSRCFGDVFTVRFPALPGAAHRHPPIVVVSDPDSVRAVFMGDENVLHGGKANADLRPLIGRGSLLLLDGDRHEQERRIMQPPFHGERVTAYGRAMQVIADEAIDEWPLGRPFSFHRAMQQITLSVIMRTVFGLTDVPFIGRVLRAPFRVAGYELPAGVVVAPCIYLAHRRAASWPEPERFDPERFLGRAASANPNAFFPFGGGGRRCIGMPFALYEMRIVLAAVLSRTRLAIAPGRPPRPIAKSVTLVPSGGMPMVLVERLPSAHVRAPARGELVADRERASHS